MIVLAYTWLTFTYPSKLLSVYKEEIRWLGDKVAQNSKIHARHLGSSSYFSIRYHVITRGVTCELLITICGIVACVLVLSNKLNYLLLVLIC